MMSKKPHSSGFGMRLKQARLQMAVDRLASLGQEELGRLVGVTGVTVGRWEDGVREPGSLALLERLAGVLGVNPGWLAFGEGQAKTTPHDNGNGKGYDYEDQTEFIPDPREKSRRKRA